MAEAKKGNYPEIYDELMALRAREFPLALQAILGQPNLIRALGAGDAYVAWGELRNRLLSLRHDDDIDILWFVMKGEGSTTDRLVEAGEKYGLQPRQTRTRADRGVLKLAENIGSNDFRSVPFVAIRTTGNDEVGLFVDTWVWLPKELKMTRWPIITIDHRVFEAEFDEDASQDASYRTFRAPTMGFYRKIDESTSGWRWDLMWNGISAPYFVHRDHFRSTNMHIETMSVRGSFALELKPGVEQARPHQQLSEWLNGSDYSGRLGATLAETFPWAPTPEGAQGL